jgi:hypothetical protein
MSATSKGFLQIDACACWSSALHRKRVQPRMQDLLASEESQLAVVPALAEVLHSRFPQDPELPVGLVQVAVRRVNCDLSIAYIWASALLTAPVALLQILLASTTGNGDAAEADALDLLHNDATMELLAQVLHFIFTGLLS